MSENITDSQPNIVLEAKNLTRRFGGLVAVNNVSFTVYKDEIFGLIGPNGAGKTTLFNLITGFIPPSSGNLLYQGKEISQKPSHKIAALGIARTFQNIRLFGEISALENVIIGRHLHTNSSMIKGLFAIPPAPDEEQKTKKEALELLELVGLIDRAEEKARNFAYGDQRRLEIARALALKPKILLLDEPAAGMNPSEKQELSQFINKIRNYFDLTIVLIEHNVPLVMGLCNRIAVLNFGELITLDKPEIVKNNPAVIEAYLGNE